MIINEIIDGDAEQIIQDNDGLKELYGKSIMVTGASGMIGSYFTYTLMKLNEDYDANIMIIPLVRNIDKLNNPVRENENVFPIVQDVTDKIDYEGDIDYIIHAASPASPKRISIYFFKRNLWSTIGCSRIFH